MPAFTRTAHAVVGVALATTIALGTGGVATAAPSDEPAPSSLWAAIAFGPYSGNTGYSANYPSREAAALAARSKCGAQECQSVAEVTNGCASLAQASSGRLGWAYARSRTGSDQAATKAAGGGARLLGWACSGYYQ